MPVILARTAGFCYGVRRAVKMALSASQKEESPLITIGPLIHNQQAIDLLKSRGVSIVSSPDEVKPGNRVLIRAHGITPELRRDLLGKTECIYDATCPHVTATQKIVERHASQDYSCIIIGDRGHAEVVGLAACAEDKGFVVENEKDVESLPPMDKICIVSQTTQEKDRFELLSQMIREKFSGEIKVFKTICSATSKRQRELRKLAEKVHIIIVVGGKTSANTRRLVEISRNMGTETYHIETAKDLDLKKIGARDVIGVTAGASTPHWVTRNVVETLQNHQLYRKSPAQRLMVGLFHFLIFSSLLLAVGAAALTAMASILMKINPRPLHLLLSFFYVLSMHIVNKRMALPSDERLLYGGLKSFSRYKNAFSIAAVCGIIFSLITAFLVGKLVFFLILVSLVFGLVYSVSHLPGGLASLFKHQRLMDIPGSKDIFMAVAWGMVVVLVPYIDGNVRNIPGLLFTLAKRSVSGHFLVL